MQRVACINQVHRRINEYIAWNAEVLLSGRWPMVGFYGESFPAGTQRARLAGTPLVPVRGLGACIAATHNDCKARKEVHNLTNWYRCAVMCDLCAATSGTTERTYMHLVEEAECLQTPLPEACTSGYMAVPGFRHEHMYFDWSHLWYLGCARDVVACCLCLLLEIGVLRRWVFHAFFMDLPQNNEGRDRCLYLAWLRCRQWLVQNSLSAPSRCPFSLNSFGRTGPGKRPTTPTWVKCSSLKQMCRWLPDFLQELRAFWPEGTADIRSAMGVLAWSVASVQHRLDTARSSWLSDAQRRPVVHELRLHLRLYHWLRLRFGALALFLPRPKHHYLMHVLGLIRRTGMNPVALDCMNSESFLGKVKRLGKHAHKRTVAYRALQRYVEVVALRFEKRRRRSMRQQWRESVISGSSLISHCCRVYHDSPPLLALSSMAQTVSSLAHCVA